MLRNKKAQTGGLVTGLVFSIATLIVGIIIAFLVVNTLTDADLLQDGRTTGTVTNETSSWLNETDYTTTGASAAKLVSGSFTLTAIWANDTGGYNVSIPIANATVSAAGVVTNNSVVTHDNVSLSYTYTLKTDTELSADGMNTNFTSGVDNISTKIPTVLLIAAIVLILGVLVLLVATWQRMGMGSGGI